MFRTSIVLVAALVFGTDAFAQLVRSPRMAPQPAGVIPAPALPLTGSPTAPGFTPFRPLPRPYRIPNTYCGGWGFAPYWPGWYDSEPVVANNYIPVPFLVPTVPLPAATPPVPAPEPRARLTLTVPSGAHVWLADREVDANASPLVLESPALRPGQSYSFHVKITWPEGQRTEERSRSVTVEAGEEKSLKYFR